MGLFDGRLTDGSGSARRRSAALLGAPVVLVVDARGPVPQPRRAAARLPDLRRGSGPVRLAGVILNRVGSARHEQVLRAARAPRSGCRCSVRCRRRDALAVPSRHLGLVTAVEHGAAATAAVDAMAELVAAHVDLDAVLRLAARRCRPARAWIPVVSAQPCWNTAQHSRALSGGRRSPSATPSTSSCCARPGAEVAVVDPLRDEALPAGTAALVLPGGFPEEHVAALAANAPLRAAVRRAGPLRGAGARRVRRACSTSASSWTAHRCAACCRPGRR